MEPNERDLIYVINKFDDFTTFSWRNKKVVLRYNIPVEIDFTDDPSLLSNLLQCPQLQVCTKKELAAYRARVQAKNVVQKIEREEIIQTGSEIENLLGED